MMRRREFITLLGGAAVLPPRRGRSRRAAMPVVGFVVSGGRPIGRRNG